MHYYWIWILKSKKMMRILASHLIDVVVQEYSGKMLGVWLVGWLVFLNFVTCMLSFQNMCMGELYMTKVEQKFGIIMLTSFILAVVFLIKVLL